MPTTDILLTALDFPLNVYAWSLRLEGQPVDFLHYGLWEAGDQDIHRAQSRASDYLFARLPQPPVAMLEAGIGLATTARRLVAEGYRYTGVTPDNCQILYARHTHQDRPITVRHGYFQRYTHEEPLDLILFQESAQYIPPSEIFIQCKRLLKPEGEVVIMDEIPAGLMVNLESSVQAWGFDLVAQEDLTRRAAPSVAFILVLIRRHRQALEYQLNLPPKKIDQLLQTLEKRDQAYASGEYTYQFLRLRKQG